MLQKQKDAAAAGCELWQVPPAVLRVSGCAGESCDWLIAHASRADLSDGGCHRVAVSMIWITTAVIGDQGTGAAAGGQAQAGHQQVATRDDWLPGRGASMTSGLLTFCLGVVMAVVLPLSQGEECQYHFTYQDGLQGTFTSPGFPEKYPMQIKCYYLFDAVNNGGVQIKFDVFHLEEKEDADSSCLYDYIDVYTVDSQGYKTVLGRYCGTQMPAPITSPQSRLLIEFVSDYTKPSTGFLGRYTFLDDNWQPFDHNDQYCGHGIREGPGGIIESPGFPRPFPPKVNCSWLIKVKDNEQVLIIIDALNIGSSSQCSRASLQLYDGYATNNTVPKDTLCGQMRSVIALRKKETTSTSSRVVVRFITGSENEERSTGFRLIWTAFQLLERGTCPEFQCAGGVYCVEGVLCDKLPQYCISHALRCNSISNCGDHDDSDERKCAREILIMTALIAIPSLAVVTLVALVIFCYRSKRVKKSTSQDQPLTSGYRQGSSKESFTSHRSVQQCVMHTSFIDSGNGACGSGEGAGGVCVAGAGAGLDDKLPALQLPDDMDIDDQQLQIPLPRLPDPNYRTHEKRASYHMKENFEDGSAIIAEI
ncbi:cubilin-like isoform X1 [Pomacea canaliculata]|uniref:cubilin-like isoform X1 n=2 Tax=Pomacea canaliculata TaxID=400727 RepID=UPI000D72AFFF|nr:cubilin-like isoform X1 [Pomacea canaliculata]